MMDYVAMSQAAYSEGTADNITGHRLLPKYSDADYSTYRNLSTGELTIAFRGSKFHKYLGDYRADTMIALGLEGYDPKFQKALEVYDSVHEAFPDSRLTLTGHSLGGGEAAYVARKRGAPAEAFDPGIGIDAIYRTIRGKRNNNIHIRRNPLDPVSIGGEFPSEGKVSRYMDPFYRPNFFGYSNNLNPHDMGAFNPAFRFGKDTSGPYQVDEVLAVKRER